MGWFDSKKEKKITELEAEIAEVKQVAKNASFHVGLSKPLFNVSYDGEKNLGELGVLKRYHLDYAGLRLRSWESYLANDATQTIIKKFVLWVIGGGLKLQSEPIESVLKSEGITIDSTALSSVIEGRFKLYSSSRKSDYTGVNNLDRLANEAYFNSIVGGDVLIIMRFENKTLNIELVDGAHIKTPNFNDMVAEALIRGNKIKNGIEVNKKGEHIAYYIQVETNEVKRILAKGAKSGREMAFMVYGSGYRIDDNRGLPIIAAALETLAKLDRYKEAAVGSAEERAKIPYFIKHEEHSTGENVFVKQMVRAHNVDSKQEIPIDIQGKELANTIALTTNKQVFNMPNGATLMALDSKNELQFKEFYSVNINAICAAIGIPPEVALSKYDSNFSASRAALKDWEHTINEARKDFSFQFYQKIYNFWLELEVMSGKIQAPGYLAAMENNDEMVLNAYRQSRFVGANVPHIDPLKEVMAERAKLGEGSKHVPLTTVEAATEALNGGDSMNNIKQYSEELKEAERLKIEPVVKTPAPVAPTKKKEE